MKEKKNEIKLECVESKEEQGFFDIFITAPNLKLIGTFLNEHGDLAVSALQMLSRNKDLEKPMVLPFRIAEKLMTDKDDLSNILKNQINMEIEMEEQEKKEFKQFFLYLRNCIDWGDGHEGIVIQRTNTIQFVIKGGILSEEGIKAIQAFLKQGNAYFQNELPIEECFAKREHDPQMKVEVDKTYTYSFPIPDWMDRSIKIRSTEIN